MKSVAVYACLFFVTAVTAKNIGDPCDQLIYGNVTPARRANSRSRLFSQHKVLQPNLNDVMAHVNCSLRGLTEVPKTIPKNVRYLDLSGNMISHIHRDDFDLYTDIKILHLDYNCISVFTKPLIVETAYYSLPVCQNMLYIEEGSFSQLNKLQTLFLNCNRMSQAPTHLPPSIEFLCLDDTLIGPLTADYAKHLPNIIVITVSFNCVPLSNYFVCPGNFTIPAKWPLSLQYLDISGNILKKIPTKTFPNGLKLLTAATSGVTTIYNKDFQTVPNLETLNLMNACFVFNGSVKKLCSLVIQEKAFMPLKRLKILNLSYNHITSLPQKIFMHNLKLESLFLQGNLLYQLPGEGKILSPLQALKYLDISGNFPYFKNRSVEDAGYRLQLEKSFAKLYALKELHIGHDPKDGKMYDDFPRPYIEIDENTFKYLAQSSRLETLSLSYLCVGKLAPKSLKHFPNLKTVYAKHNQIGKEDIKGICHQIQNDRRPKRRVFGIFRTQSLALSLLANSTQETGTSACNLTHTADFSHCLITSVKQALLPVNVSILNLSNNNLQYILNDDLEHLRFLCELNLQNNPLTRIYPLAIRKLRYLKILLIQNIGAAFSFDLSFIQRTSSYFTFQFRGKHSQVLHTLITLPNYNGTLPAVGTLDLSRNFLDGLYILNKNNFGYFSNMRILILQNCRIKSPISSFFTRCAISRTFRSALQRTD